MPYLPYLRTLDSSILSFIILLFILANTYNRSEKVVHAVPIVYGVVINQHGNDYH